MPVTELIQFLLLLLTSLLFAAAFLFGFLHMRAAALSVPGATLPHEASMGLPARLAVSCAVLLGIALLIWRASTFQTLTLPVSDPFDAFLLLGLLLAIWVIYFRWTRHLRSLSFFLLPMIAILLILGLVLALLHPGEDHLYHNAWILLHIASIIAATVLLALACVGAVVYLRADRQLKRKGLDASHRWMGLPPLASIEKFVKHMIYWGFHLLSIATVAGALQIAAHDESPQPKHSRALKLAFALLSWIVYAIILQVPLNPRFRGPRAAWLTITGFVLFMGAFAAARWV